MRSQKHACKTDEIGDHVLKLNFNGTYNDCEFLNSKKRTSKQGKIDFPVFHAIKVDSLLYILWCMSIRIHIYMHIHINI